METVVEHYENRIGPKSKLRVSRSKFQTIHQQAGKKIKSIPSYTNTRVATTRAIDRIRLEKIKQQQPSDEEWEMWNDLYDDCLDLYDDRLDWDYGWEW